MKVKCLVKSCFRSDSVCRSHPNLIVSRINNSWRKFKVQPGVGLTHYADGRRTLLTSYMVSTVNRLSATAAGNAATAYK